MSRTIVRRLRLGDHRAAYQHLSTYKLAKSMAVLRMCRSPWLVENSMFLIGKTSAVIGDYFAYNTFVKWTMFEHFCAGEDERGVKHTLSLLAKLNIGSILDYAAEAEVPIVKQDQAPDLSMTNLSTNTQLKYASDEETFDLNMKLYVLCVAHASLNSWQYGIGYAAVKITGCTDPQLLARVSSVLLYIRQQWVRFFTTDADVPPLEQCRVVFRKEEDNLVKGCPPQASRDVVRAGLQKWSGNKLSAAELDAILDWLDPKKTGSIDYLNFTKMIPKCLGTSHEEDTRVLEPLMRHCPQLQLTSEELRLWSNTRHRIRTICQVAAELKVHVMIDAEQTFYQMAIDHLTRDMQREFNRAAPIVFNTYQCYMKISKQRLLNDMSRAKREGWVWAGKMVRGAYDKQERETAAKYSYEDPIFAVKEETDKCYNTCAMIILKEFESDPATKIGVLFGTHNPESLQLITDEIVKRSINPRSISFAQLLGMADNLTMPLAQAGFNTFKYVPYGPVKETIQYLSRRARENSSVLRGENTESEMMWREFRRRLGLGS